MFVTAGLTIIIAIAATIGLSIPGISVRQRGGHARNAANGCVQEFEQATQK